MHRPDDEALEAMLRELEAEDPVWARVRHKLALLDARTPEQKGTNPMDCTYLTPDALLYYCEARMNGVDTQMEGIMNEQETTNADEQAVHDAIAAFDSYSNDNAQLIDQLKAAVAEVKDPATQAKLQAVLSDVEAHNASIQPSAQVAPEAIPFSSTQVQGWTDTLKNVDSDLSSGAELNMIQLQSLMSERQVATQLTTNLVQSLGDQMNKIADNIGK
jgi:hypothetical protein